MRKVKADLAREEAFERERDEDEARYQHYLRTGEAFEHSEVAAWLDSLGTDNPLPPPHRIRLHQRSPDTATFQPQRR